MSHPPIIGLLGAKRAGKDTFAAQLAKEHGYTRYAFADNVRAVALAIDPIIGYVPSIQEHERLSDVVNQYGWEKAKEDDEVRRFLQRLGTEGIRSVDRGFWVRPVLANIQWSKAPAVITDVRFNNEATAIQQAGGLLVRINRLGHVVNDPHVSENELKDYPVDHDITAGSVEALRKQADWLATKQHYSICREVNA